MTRRQQDRMISTVAKVVAGVAGAAVMFVFLRELPSLVRYLKIERM